MVRMPQSRADNRQLVNRLAMIVGAVFLLVGILGFIPGITTNLLAKRLKEMAPLVPGNVASAAGIG